jgi:hypothetical protein
VRNEFSGGHPNGCGIGEVRGGRRYGWKRSRASPQIKVERDRQAEEDNRQPVSARDLLCAAFIFCSLSAEVRRPVTNRLLLNATPFLAVDATEDGKRLVGRKRGYLASRLPLTVRRSGFDAKRATTECGKQKTARYFFNDRTWATSALISSSLNLSLKGFIFSLPSSFKPSLIASEHLVVRSNLPGTARRSGLDSGHAARLGLAFAVLAVAGGTMFGPVGLDVCRHGRAGEGEREPTLQ